MICGLIGMYWVKCKQTQVQQRYVHILFCLTVIRPWQKLATGGHGHVICMGNLRGAFSHENTPEGHTTTHTNSLFPYKQVNGRNSDHEWLRMTNAFILYDLVWKVQKHHATNREGSFNSRRLNTSFVTLQSEEVLHVVSGPTNDWIWYIHILEHDIKHFEWTHHNFNSQYPG